jgi:hypothetical protein
MSDTSVNPSNESPRQSPPPHIASPSPTQSPGARSMPSSCMPSSTPLRARRMSAHPLSHYQSGSEIYATPPSPTTAPSSTRVKASKTGDSPPTSLGTAPPRSESKTCTPPRRASRPASPDSERVWTSSCSTWGLPEQGSAWGAIATSSTSSPPPSTTTPGGADASAIKAVDGLRTKGRVMSSVASVPRHSYVFCQYVNPSLGHDGGPCTCYDIKGG